VNGVQPKVVPAISLGDFYKQVIIIITKSHEKERTGHVSYGTTFNVILDNDQPAIHNDK